MREHNSLYEGDNYTIDVSNNGYILRNNQSARGWRTKQFSTFEELVNALAQSLGLVSKEKEVSKQKE